MTGKKVASGAAVHVDSCAFGKSCLLSFTACVFTFTIVSKLVYDQSPTEWGTPTGTQGDGSSSFTPGRHADVAITEYTMLGAYAVPESLNLKILIPASP
jgi:hypothetical protein